MEKNEITMNEQLLIRPMHKKDVDVIAEMEKRNFSVPWSAESFRRVLDDEFSFGIVALLKMNIIAYAVFGALGDYAELWNIAVDEGHRRKGVGKEMLRRLIDMCKEKKVSSLFLQVRESNEPARKLYVNNGFTFVMVQKKYYHSPVEDALVFRLDIPPYS
jgi:ribosomal-protein-alanine N-acetyltransferase